MVLWFPLLCVTPEGDQVSENKTIYKPRTARNPRGASYAVAAHGIVNERWLVRG